MNSALLDRVCGVVADGGASQPQLVQRLRLAFPGLAFSLCDDNDVPSRLQPLAEGEGYALYGIATGEHCASLTARLDGASGLAVALKDADD